ncbi:TIGR01777 family oxidoreductase [Halalkalibacter alkalisediminis]|uniref:TIGR01777 family oxidoreductase n=1 Tax=Halalkalibacter alkalisediminis TaxID=935616 RepID=A0ABV6NA56_9BACI|nr:TIGR01777 family oxidoreductase [Halalkalibacter alkalisediminis]
MKIAIAGGTGFIGQKLTNHLISVGHSIYILTRDASNKPAKPNVTYIEWLTDGTEPAKSLGQVDAIVNLAGESIGASRWTSERKDQILQSRIQSTQSMVRLIEDLPIKPRVLVNASAIGYYGHSLTHTFTEESKPVEENFLSQVVQRWEQEAEAASVYGVRVTYCRLGVVLDSAEGALTRMLLPFRFFAGGPLGSGEQWLSWIHIDDVVKMFTFAIEHSEIKGPFNLTAPVPLKMNDFGKIVAHVLSRPYWLPAPSFALKLLLGEMSTLVLDGQKVLPHKAETAGYTFLHPSLEPALSNLLNS